LKNTSAQRPKFFFDQNDIKSIISILKSKFPENIKETLRIADQACKRRYYYHRINIKFDKTIKWSLIPKREIEWNCCINRHNEWLHLAKAYLYTRNNRYMNELKYLINSWVDANPYPNKYSRESITWRLIDAGIRARNWVWTILLLSNEPLFEDQTKLKMINALKNHAEYLYKYYKYGSPNNHRAMEMEGLLEIAIMFPEMPDADKWKTRAVNLLKENFVKNVYSDGVQWEMSPSYHIGCLNWYGEPLILAERNKIKMPVEYISRYKKMFDFLLDLSLPDDKVPAFGDSDYNYDSIKIPLALGALLFEDPFLKPKSEFDPELLWLFGKNALKDYLKIKPANKKALDSSFDKGGIYVSRSDWSRKANYLVFDCGPLGGWHGNIDLLSFCLSVNGKPLLIDPGRFTYIDNKWRRYFQSTPAHNTVTVDNMDQFIQSWKVRNRKEYTMLEDKVISDIRILKAEHYRYRKLKDPVTHTREIVFSKNHFLLIKDSFTAKGRHNYKQYFHFAPSKVEVNGRVVNIKSNNLKVKLFNNDGAKIKLEKGWVSPAYNKKYKAPVIYISKDIKGSGDITTLIRF